MPKRKDLKRIVRSRMKKTGESYTAARLQVTRRPRPVPDRAALAGKSDAVVKKATGRDWSEWLRILDAANAMKKTHGEIARYVSSLGTPDWWSQTVTVGYERIRGLRDIGQRSDGGYAASKSRTFAVPVSVLFDAFAKPRLRARWLPAKATIRGSSPRKRVRLSLEDGTRVDVWFTAKGGARSTAALEHTRLPDRSSVERVKRSWAERFDALAELLG